MSKFITRWTIILVSAYLVLCYLAADIFAINIWRQFYFLLFELSVCLCISKQGVYHCRYIKWTAYAILFHDMIVCSDILFDWLPEGVMAVVPPLVIVAGMLTTTSLAVRHYIKVRRLKKVWKANHPS